MSEQETPVMASFLVQLQACGLTAFPKETPSQMLFNDNCEVLQKHTVQIIVISG